MKHSCLLCKIGRFLSVFAFVWLGTSTSTLADDNISAPTVKVTLLTNPTITLGEPIVLQYRVSNTTKQKLGVYFGIRETEWYTLTLANEKGQSLPVKTDVKPLNKSGYQAIKGGFINTGDSTSDSIVVTQKFVVSNPGKYILTMHIHLPYELAISSQESIPERLVQSTRENFAQDYVFPIVVGNPDLNKLRMTAEGLRKTIVVEQDGTMLHAMVDALFSMPEAQAAESWAYLKYAPAFDADLFASKLASLGTKKASDILADMLWNPVQPLSTDITSAINRHLLQMYTDGNEPLKAHIRSLYKSHGVKLDKNFSSPTNID